MNFQGQELISRATYVSNRSLVALAFAKILAISASIDVSEFTILGVSPGAAKIEYVTNFLLVFLALNHCLSWYGDLKSFVAWNHPAKVVSNMDILADESAQVSKLEYHTSRIEEFSKLQKDWLKDADTKTVRDPDQYSAEIVQTAKDLMQSTARLERYAALYLWGWFLALPLGSTLYALWL